MRVHLDTDLASDTDDACALAMLLGWPGVDVAGVTTTVDLGGRRAGYVTECLGLARREEIPVAAGAEVSLTTLRAEGGIPDGTRWWPRPVPARPSAPGAALDLLDESIEHGATVVAVGPWTNLALLAVARPGRLDGVPIVVMGGWIHPPAPGLPAWGPEYDWNVQCDTRAAEILFASGADLTVVTIASTLQTHLRAAHLPRLRAAGPLGALLARQAEAHGEEYALSDLGRAHVGLPDDLLNFHHDPLACAVAVGWDGVTTEVVHLRPVMDGDVLHFERDDAGRPTRLVTNVDGDAFSERWLTAVRGRGTARMTTALLGGFGELDARQPQAGGFELRAGGDHVVPFPQPVQCRESAALDDAAAERDALVVVLAVELEAEQAVDERVRVAAVETMPAERLVDADVGADGALAQLVDDDIGVALEHGDVPLQLFEHRALTFRLHRAEQRARVADLTQGFQRCRVGKIEMAELLLERVGPYLVGPDVFARESQQPRADPRHACVARRARPLATRARNASRRRAAPTPARSRPRCASTKRNVGVASSSGSGKSYWPSVPCASCPIIHPDHTPSSTGSKLCIKNPKNASPPSAPAAGSVSDTSVPGAASAGPCIAPASASRTGASASSVACAQPWRSTQRAGTVKAAEIPVASATASWAARTTSSNACAVAASTGGSGCG